MWHSLLSFAERFLKFAKRGRERSKQDYIREALATVKSYVSDTPYAALHFGTFPKLGINPRSEYKTPLGIYAYPLTSKIYQDFMNLSLPFAADSPYVVLFKFKGNVLNFETFSKDDLEVIINNIYGILGESPPPKEKIVEWQRQLRDIDLGIDLQRPEETPQKLIWRTINRAKSSAYEPGSSGSQFMNITRLISKTPKQWNVLLRKLGYDVLVDLGKGFIHHNEPIQLVILNPSAVEVVDIFENFMYLMEEQKSEISGKRELIAVRPKTNIEWFHQIIKEHPILEPVILKLFRVSDLEQIPVYSSLLGHKSSWALLEKFFEAKYISKEDKEKFIKSLLDNDHGGLFSAAINPIHDYYGNSTETVPIWFARYILKNEIGYRFNPETFISQEDLMRLAGEMPEVLAASPNWTHLSSKNQEYFLHNPEILRYRLMNDPRLFNSFPERIWTLYKNYPETREPIAMGFNSFINTYLGSVELKDVNTGTYFYEVEANLGSRMVIETLIDLSDNKKKADWAIGSRMTKAAWDQLYQWLLTHSTPEMRTLWNEYNEPKL